MIFKTKFRKQDKEILKDVKLNNGESFVINVKADNDSQVFSSYNYDNKDLLDSDLCDYLKNNAKLCQSNKDIKIRIFSKEKLEASEVKSALKSHFKRDYLEAKVDLKKSNIFSLVSIIFGLLSMVLLWGLYKFTDNYFLNTLFEIITWVFVWEAVDSFFLKRPALKRSCKRIQKLYSADVEIIKVRTPKKTKSE